MSKDLYQKNAELRRRGEPGRDVCTQSTPVNTTSKSWLARKSDVAPILDVQVIHNTVYYI